MERCAGLIPLSGKVGARSPLGRSRRTGAAWNERSNPTGDAVVDVLEDIAGYLEQLVGQVDRLARLGDEERGGPPGDFLREPGRTPRPSGARDEADSGRFSRATASVEAVPTRIVLSGGVEVTVNPEPHEVHRVLSEDLKTGEPFSVFQKEEPSQQRVLVAPELVAYFEDRYVETDGPLIDTVG